MLQNFYFVLGNQNILQDIGYLYILIKDTSTCLTKIKSERIQVFARYNPLQRQTNCFRHGPDVCSATSPQD